MTKHQSLFIIIFLVGISSSALASTNDANIIANTQNNDEKSFYVSWGYNKDYWTNSDIHISQPALNNNFVVNDVHAGDYPGWNTGIFNKDLMSPQYNIRFGYFFNPARTWGIELSFDHTKYNTNLNQVARISGMINGQTVIQNSVLTSNYFYYALHNGANNLMLNLVRRKTMVTMPTAKLQLVGIGKAGMGVMLPHPENTIFEQTVNVGPKAWNNYFGWNHGWWQMGGWTAGFELGMQLVFRKRVYLEFTDKEAYVNLSDIQVYQGQASQTMWLNEMIGSFGVMF